MKDKMRPEKRKTKALTVAYYCVRMNCFLQHSGSTYPSYQNANKAEQSNIADDINGCRKCSRNICTCDCCVNLPQNQRYEMALAYLNSKENRMDVLNVDEPSNIVYLLGNIIASGVQNGVMRV